MPSPFPGMDPFIESSGLWGDFHTSLLGAIRAALNATLPRRYRANIDVYVWIHEPAARVRRRRIAPDVYVVERPERSRVAGRVATVPAPRAIVLPRVERRKHKSIQILDRRLNRVVTVLEVLSPSNKAPGDDREAYLLKRDECLANRVNLVELDLLRGGPRLPLGEPPPQIEDFCIMVCRSWEYPRASIWSFGLRDPLPEIFIPLAPDVPDGLLALRPCVDRVYDEGTYQTELDYHEPLSPRLRKKDVAWTRALLAAMSSHESP